MVLKKKVKAQPEKDFGKPVISDELAFRIMNIAGQTGISPPDLILKWVLQEETLIGVIQRIKEPMAETKPNVESQNKTAAQVKRAKTITPEPGNPNYRNALLKRAQKLKKEGMTLKKIAETFNEEKVATVSGTGKWYSSSIANLLSSKI